VPVFFVAHNGAGFDMAHAKRLFLPFHRLHQDSEFPGEGIGLATVVRAVHRHSGVVCAYGAVKQGATFRFTLLQTRRPAKT
jgi:light-regulated signal transduction histidine kinase (bacteriophytochrome)